MTTLDTTPCVCGYIDPPPRNLSDQLCDPCEARRALQFKKEKDEMDVYITTQITLPESDPKRIFTDAELRDVKNVQCDSQGFNRTLLRDIRKRLGIL